MASVNKWIGIGMYANGESIAQISKSTGIPISTVRSRLLREGVLRTRGDAIRLAASQGRWSHGKGEQRLISPEHRNSIVKSNKSRDKSKCAGISIKPNGYAEITQGERKGTGQHRLVMEMAIGRKLMPNEVVHHIDHNRNNNTLENLALMTRSEHARIHAQENHHFRERDSNGRFC